jgi:hypothetical protein
MQWGLSGTRPAPSLTSLAPRVNEPALYISADGMEERLISQLAEGSGGESELWVVPGAGHTEGLKVHPAEYEARVTGFFETWLLAE